MARKKDPNVALRKLQEQVAKLTKQLAASKKQMKQLQVEYVKDVEAATKMGYELGFVEAEEKQILREKAVAAAVDKFEKSYASTKRTKSKSKSKTATRKSNKSSAKRRGRPAGKAAKPATKKAHKRRGRPSKKQASQTVLSEAQVSMNSGVNGAESSA